MPSICPRCKEVLEKGEREFMDAQVYYCKQGHSFKVYSRDSQGLLYSEVGRKKYDPISLEEIV